MSKSLKIILLILAFFSIIFSLNYYFNFWSFQKLENKSTLTQTLTQNITPEQIALKKESFQIKNKVVSIPQVPTFSLPVNKEYFSNIYSFSIDGSIENKEKLFLAFFLEPKAEIKAIFNGIVFSISKLKQGEFTPNTEEPDITQLWIEEKNKTFKASYLFVGHQTMVEEGDIIKEGDILAEAQEGGLSFRSGANFSISILNDNNETLGISKDLFDFTK